MLVPLQENQYRQTQRPERQARFALKLSAISILAGKSEGFAKIVPRQEDLCAGARKICGKINTIKIAFISDYCI
jgi:hypothetical protein